MKPLTKGGGLVDFKDNLIFEEYKDKETLSAFSLKKEIKDKYGYVPKDIYAKIINYQIKKYGRALSKCNSAILEFENKGKFEGASHKSRKRSREVMGEKYRTDTLIERHNDNEKL